jgi:hypothetical protein
MRASDIGRDQHVKKLLSGLCQIPLGFGLLLGIIDSISAVQIPANPARDRCIFSARSLLFFMGISDK